MRVELKPCNSVRQNVQKEFGDWGFKSHWGKLSTAISKNLSMVNVICVGSFSYNNVIFCARFQFKNDGDWQRQRLQWNLNTEQKLKLRVSWPQGLIPQAEFSGCGVKSQSGWLSRTISKIYLAINVICTGSFSYKHVITCSRFIPLHSCG